ncbi:MAG: N-acetylglucosaminyl-phosphatidylinositol de-N-acetylase [Peltula sp. TS41687]|nr:MAG: N-acetylglucosaminyl-phosphatidylinositol de-N-acetylase [Peltula sp. TS41687]
MNELQLICNIAYLWVVKIMWQLLLRIQSHSFPPLQGKRICLLIAHPDDEAMFFAPTLLALTDPSLDNRFVLLCMSSGDADGIGETRKIELMKSTDLLGLQNEDLVYIVEDPDFPDSMTATWDPSRISQALTRALVIPDNTTDTKTSHPPETTVDVLITFDRHGVSSHPNHCSLYHGARRFLDTLMKKHPSAECPIALYTLTSTTWIRKYSSFLDLPLTMIQTLWFRKRSDNPPAPLFLVNSLEQYSTARSAMTDAHQSQMRWFRWGWILLSRYMFINDLKLENMR